MNRSGSPRRRPGRRHPRAKKRLSQNFLVDSNMARHIVDLVGAGPRDVVVEVGPGTGAITRGLVERAGHVHALEVDRELMERLRVEFEDTPGLTLHEADALTVRLADLAPQGGLTVVGNLPYHITSDLVLWLLEQHASVKRAVVMMQREVARRLTAEPGTREAGSLTLALRYRCEAERLLDVPPTCFRPVPKVTSSVVAIRFRETPAVRPRDEAWYFRTVRAAFGERRKTLANALAHGLHLPREAVESAAASAGISPRERGERLSLEDFRRLADALLEARDTGATARGPEAS